MKLKLLLVFAIFSIVTQLFSQEGDVTLTVIGQGKTIEEAQQQAFRDAIMQTYGVFVSSNTEVVGEKLKADSVNTITNGVVKKYVVISTSESPDGTITTMLKVSVSTSQIGAFFSNAGGNASLNGSLFAFAIQQQRLNENNEVKAVSSAIKISEGILSRSFNYNVSIATSPYEVKKNGVAEYRVPTIIRISFNENVELFNKFLADSLEAISLSEVERSVYSSSRKPTYTSYIVMLPPGKPRKDEAFPDTTLRPYTVEDSPFARLRRVTLRSRESALMISRLMHCTVPFMASRCVVEDNAKIFSTANPSALRSRLDNRDSRLDNRDSILLACFGRPEDLKSDLDPRHLYPRRILNLYSIESRYLDSKTIEQEIDDEEFVPDARYRTFRKTFWLFPRTFHGGALVYNINFYVDYSLEDIGKISGFSVQPRKEPFTPEEMSLPDARNPRRPVAANKKGGESGPAVAGPGEYVVKSGDGGAKIAKANGVSISDLVAVNPGVDWTKLKVGQKVQLPKK